MSSNVTKSSDHSQPLAHHISADQSARHVLDGRRPTRLIPSHVGRQSLLENLQASAVNKNLNIVMRSFFFLNLPLAGKTEVVHRVNIADAWRPRAGERQTYEGILPRPLCIAVVTISRIIDSARCTTLISLIPARWMLSESVHL